MAKVRTNVADYQTKTIPKMSQRQLKICQRDKIAPNLVTLVGR